MGFMDEYNKALQEAAVKSASASGSSSKYMEEYYKAGGSSNSAGSHSLPFRSAPISDRYSSRMTVSHKKKKKEEEEEKKRKWYESELFDDGYDFGDVSKAILGVSDDTASLKDLTVNSFERGYYNSIYGEESFKAMNGGQNKKDEYAQILAGDEYQFTPGNDAAGAISGAMELFGQLFRQHTNPRTLTFVGTAAGAAAIAGNAGPQVLVPEEIVTVPAAATAAFVAGSTASNLEIEAGHAYNEMLEKGISEETAKKIAWGVGGVNASLEFVQTDQLIKAFKATKASGTTKRFAKKIADELVARGIVVANETAQEVAQEAVTMTGVQAASQLEKGESAYSWDDVTDRLKYIAKSSALSFGLMNAPATVTNTASIVNEQHKANSLTKNEQAVVDKVTADRVSEAEKDGTKLSNSDKKKIKEVVVSDMENGFIPIDTIEEVLGGEKYEQYKQASEWESSLQTEFDKLNKMKQGEMTGEQVDRREALRTQLKNVKATSTLAQQKSQIRDEVMGMVKSDRLLESYREYGNSRKAFEADVNQYSEKQRVIVQKAIDAKTAEGNPLLSNSRHTHTFVDFVAKISEDTDVDFEFTDTKRLQEAGFALEGQTIDGFYNPKESKVTLNLNSPKARQFVVGHEITHALEGTDLYDALRKSVFDYAKMKNQYGVRMESIQKRYKEGTDFEAELTADLVGEYIFSDTDFINNLSTQNRNVFQKVFDEIKYLCKVATAGSKEARELEKVKRAFEKAYREGGKAQTDAETKLSVSENAMSDSDGKQLTKEQQDYFKDSKVRDENGSLKVMYHGTPNGDFTVFKDGTYFTDNKEYADKYQNPSASSISTGKVASAPKTFEVYLDIKKPFDINDAEARNIYINDYIKGGNAMGINPYLSDAEYDKISSIDWTEGEDLREFLIDNEYDYDGLVLDEGATGGYGDEVQSRGKSYVVFSHEQVKNIDNTKPTADPDIRFSLSNPVEETKDLIAVHNLHSAELVETLKLSGLPSPSVAIIKAKDGHEKYGDVSLILPKETIDPQTNKANRIYGSDAWTPTRSNAQVEYEVDYGVQRQFERTIEELSKNVANGVFSKSSVLGMDGIEDSTGLNLNEIAKKISDYDAVQAAYVAENGSDVEVVYRTKEFDTYGNDALKGYIDKVGEQEVARLTTKMMTGDRLTAEEIETAKDALVDNWIIKKAYALRQKPELRDIRIAKFRERLTNMRVEDFVRHAWEFYEDSGATTDEINLGATGDNLRAAVNRTDVEAWVTEKLQGLLSDPGIYNGKEIFTPSGKRRSFKETHWDYTAENIVRAMNIADARGANVWNVSGEAIIATATPEYKNIDEVRADKGRLFNAEYDDYEQIKDGISAELQTVTNDIIRTTEHISDNQYDEEQIIGRVIMEAAQGTKTVAGVKRVFQKNGYRIGDAQAKSVLSLFDHASSVPTGYFEAKPQRVVGFDEVGVYVIPYDADVKLKQELLNRGCAIAEYDPKVEGDRTRVLNQFEEYKFSLSNVGEQHTPDSLSALRLTAEESSVVAPTVSETESVADMFPNNAVPVHAELEQLVYERDQIFNALEVAVDRGSADEVGKLAEEYEALNTRIKALENEESERTGSLTDADAPPEMDAPLNIESENYNPYSGVTLDEITRSTRTYSDRNPGARQYIEEGALGFLYDVNNSTHGERWYNDELYYATGGEQGFGGTARSTTADIEYLKDSFGYTWEQLRKAAEDVVKGEVRSAAAKRVEFLIHNRLMEGYTDVDGRRYEPNQNYITFLNNSFAESVANENSEGSFNSLLENADQYAPTLEEQYAPKLNSNDPRYEEDVAPIFEDKGGQTTMFEPEKPNTSGKVGKVLTQPSKPDVQSNIGMKALNLTVDKGQAVENLSLKTGNDELQAKYNYALGRYTEARAQYFMENGADGLKSYKKIVDEILKSGKRNAFEDYLGHALNMDRMSLEARYGTPNKAVFGDSVTAEMSQKTVAEYEANNPEFKQWAEEIYEIMRYCRQMLVDGNLASQETADLWEQQYPHYVPIERSDKKGRGINVPLDTNKTGVNAPIHRATGGNTNIEPFLNTIAKRIEQTYRAVARNDFGIELKNTLGTTINAQQNNSSVDSLIDLIDDQDSQLLKPGSLFNNPTFTVFENGERVEFEITEELFDSLKPAGALGYRNKVISKIGDIRRNLLTNWNTKFSLWRNPQKDAKEVFLNSQHPTKTYMNMFVPTKDNAWIQILANGEYAQEYHKNGGKSVTYYDRGKNDFVKEDGTAKKIVKNTVGVPFRSVMRLGEIIEEVPRLAEYTASRKEGRSVEQSMLDAARVTTNFAAGGDVTKFANAHGCTFLNASVQGAAQHVRNFREGYNKEGIVGATKVLGKYILTGVPALVFNHLMWDDDEDYEELNDYVKENYWVVWKTGDGKFIRLPKGRTEAVMNEAIQQTMNLVTGNDEFDLSTLNELFWNNIAPNNPRENNIFAPIRQAFNNEAWYGDEIVPSRLQDLPTEEQYDESTDALSKWLGENFDPFELGPYRINYLLDQYSGGIGDTLLPMMTPEAESGDNSLVGNLIAPWKKEVTTDSVLNNKNPGNFYELKDELEVVSNGKNATEEDKMRSMYLDSVSWEMGDLYAQKREIQNSDLPDDQKYEKVREIQKHINEIANNALNQYNSVSIDGKYATVGDRRFDYSDYSSKWYEIEGEYLEREQNAVKRYGITPSEYWNDTDLYYHADWYFDDKYATVDREVVANLVFGGKRFAPYAAELGQIKGEDKNGDGKTDSGTKKTNVFSYIDGLNVTDTEKMIMRKMSYPSEDKYNDEIVDYLNGRDDIDYNEMKSILEALGAKVDDRGYITW